MIGKISTVEFEVGGVKRGFRLGTYTWVLIAEETGITDIPSVFSEIGKQNLKVTAQFYFCTAKHYASSKKQDVDFTALDVSDWLDELGEEKTAEITTELTKIYKPKNSNPPETPGASQ